MRAGFPPLPLALATALSGFANVPMPSFGSYRDFYASIGGRATPPRYQVDGPFLVDLADLAELDRNDPVQLDIKNGF